MIKHFSKELAMSNKDNEDFENSTKCWICDNDFINCDVNVRDHIIGKYGSSWLDNLDKNLYKDDFKCSSQDFDNNVLDLVKQKGFDPYKDMIDFEKFKEELPIKGKFYSSLIDKEIVTKNMIMF